MTPGMRLLTGLLVLFPGVCFGDLSWTFEGSASLPDGWIGEGQGGSWTVATSDLDIGEGNVLQAELENTSPFPFGGGVGAGGDQEVQIDVYTSEFRFQDIQSAFLNFEFDMESDACNDPNCLDALVLTLHSVIDGVLDKGAGLTLWQHQVQDAASTVPVPMSVVDDGIGVVPQQHEDDVSIYRIRMRVFDGDVDRMSLIGAEVDNLEITAASSLTSFDYNGNGVADAPDYTVWRNTVGSVTDLRADGSGDGVVGVEDYHLWRKNFGAQVGTGSGSLNHPLGDLASPIPEPGCRSLALGLTIFSAVFIRLRRSSWRFETPLHFHLAGDH